MLKILDSKRTTLYLSLAITLLMLFGYSLMRFRVLAQTNLEDNETVTTPQNVVYFVSPNTQLVEDALQPQILQRDNALLEQYNLSLQATSDWKTISDLLAKHELDVVIVHHSAMDLVVPSEIEAAIKQGVVVAGIGIPGLDLAELAGDPALFTSTWSAEEGYTTSYYFYIYSYEVVGDQAEIDRLRASGWQVGEEASSDIIVQKPISIKYNASTDTLLDKDMAIMFSLIHTHILNIDGNNN